jgi:hypothetical protein
MTVIHIGDGRHIELDEGAVNRPPPPPPKPPAYRENYKPRQTAVPKRRQSTQNTNKFGAEHFLRKKMVSIPGYKEWWDYKNALMGKYRATGSRIGEGRGRGRSKLGYILGQAKRKIKRDMANIDKEFPDIDPMAREALEGAVSVLREPTNQSSKLAAARLILEFTKSKPVAKSDVTVNAAEAWLASIGKED